MHVRFSGDKKKIHLETKHHANGHLVQVFDLVSGFARHGLIGFRLALVLL
jgi:hypothetical protein